MEVYHLNKVYPITAPMDKFCLVVLVRLICSIADPHQEEWILPYSIVAASKACLVTAS